MNYFPAPLCLGFRHRGGLSLYESHLPDAEIEKLNWGLHSGGVGVFFAGASNMYWIKSEFPRSFAEFRNSMKQETHE